MREEMIALELHLDEVRNLIVALDYVIDVVESKAKNDAAYNTALKVYKNLRDVIEDQIEHIEGVRD